MSGVETTPAENLKPVLFSVMPYGTRTHPETGTRFDFDRIHHEIIAPAGEDAGCRVIRSDHETLGGIVHVSMFERLLLADVVVADVSLPNPNVFYELGIRHATRPKSTVTVGCFTGTSIPFDIAPLRHLTYTLAGGVPSDIDNLRASLTTRIVNGLGENARYDSPLFSLIAGYPKIELSRDACESYRDRVHSILAWRSVLTDAVVDGDKEAVDRLAESANGNPELLADAVLAYRDLEAWDAMIDLLAKHSSERTASETELLAFAKNRRNQTGDRTDAIRMLETLVARDSMTSERGALLGRIHKDAWLEMRTSDPRQAGKHLLNAIDAYRRGLEADPRDPYPGVNLTTLLAHAGDAEELARVSPVVAFALARRGGANARDYFDLAALCELSCVIDDAGVARRAAMLATGKPHPVWARASTKRNLLLLGEVRPLARELAEYFS